MRLVGLAEDMSMVISAHFLKLHSGFHMKNFASAYLGADNSQTASGLQDLRSSIRSPESLTPHLSKPFSSQMSEAQLSTVKRTAE